MPVLDLNDPVGFQLLRLSSDDDDEMMEGVACLLGLRHNSPLHRHLRPLDGGRFAISKGGASSSFSQTSKALRGGENGGSENGKNSNSLRAATNSHSMTVDLGVQDFNKKRKRATREEVAILRRAFVVNPLPPLEVRMSIAQQLNWTPRKVKIWFQNERAKVRKRTREGDLLERTRTPDSQDEIDRSPSRSGVLGGAHNHHHHHHHHHEAPTTLVVGGGGVGERPFTLLNRSATPSAVLQTVPTTTSSPSRIRSPFTPPRLSSSAPDSSPTTEGSPLSHPQIHCAAASAFSSHPANFNPLSLLDHQQRLVIPQS